MKKIFLLLLGLFALVPAGRAQWQTVTYTLHGGWNAIYLQGDATHTTVDNIFKDAASVISVWRWNPNPNPAQFKASSMVPTASTPEWSVWVKGDAAQTTLTSLSGQMAYLVRCTGLPADTYQVSITQRLLPPRSTWVRNGANFLGFPALEGATAPTLSNYFATFPAAIASNARVYKYIGGDIGPGNPVQIYSPSTEKIDRNQAYWFEATVVGDFYAPLEITPSASDGLSFGRTGSFMTVRVRNRTSAAVTVTIAPVDSVAEPVAPSTSGSSTNPVPTTTIPTSGTTTLSTSTTTTGTTSTGTSTATTVSTVPTATTAGNLTALAPVPMIRRTFNSATATNTDTAITGSYTEVIPPLSEVQLTVGVDRSKMTTAAGTGYASFLRFTDSASLMNILLPCSARVANLAGLWMGDVQVSGVLSTVAGATGSTTPRPFPLRIIIHVDNTGVARLLSQIYVGKLAGSADAIGLCTRELALQVDQKQYATRLCAGHLPLDLVAPSSSGSFALGGFMEVTVPLAFNDPTNPFIHTYHPDHDNRDARFAPYTAPGVESYTVTRTMRFTFSSAATVLGTDPTASTWGGSRMVGSFTESITGLHRQTLSVSGSFELRRLNEIGELVIN
jgi:hypothetical protein